LTKLSIRLFDQSVLLRQTPILVLQPNLVKMVDNNYFGCNTSVTDIFQWKKVSSFSAFFCRLEFFVRSLKAKDGRSEVMTMILNSFLF
jgi:hypothetical protein